MKKEKQKDGFVQIPGFPSYAINVKQKIVMNTKSGNIVVPKRINNKYQLTSPSGVRKEKAFVDLLPLVKEKVAKETKKVSATKEKAVSSKPIKPHVELDKNTLLAIPEVKKVMELTGPKHRKIYELDKLAYTNKQIQTITGSTCQVVSRDLWMYKKGKLVA